MKPSRFNRYINYDDKILLFNGISCGFAEIEPEIYDAIIGLEEGQLTTDQTKQLNKYISELKRGRFIVEDLENELGNLRMMHNIRKYNATSLGLTIAPTLACNFRCTYCFEGELEPVVMQEEIQEAIIDFVSKKIKTIDHLSVSWFGGEPLLRRDIIFNMSQKLIVLCDENNCQYNSSIITNGWLLNREVANKLRDCHINMVQVTLDGPKDIHNQRRPLKSGVGTFDRIINNIVEVAEIIPVVIRINTDKDNQHHVLDVFELIKSKGLLGKVYPYLGHVIGDTEACVDIQSSCYDTESFAKVEINTYQELNKTNIPVPIPYPKYLPNFCGAVTLNAYVIDPLGRVYKCWNHIGNEEESTGNVLQIENFDHRTVKWLDIQPFDNEQCCNCDVLPLCSGGCPDYYHKGHHLKTKQPNCVTWRYYLDDILLASYQNWKAHTNQPGLEPSQNA